MAFRDAGIIPPKKRVETDEVVVEVVLGAERSGREEVGEEGERERDEKELAQTNGVLQKKKKTAYWNNHKMAVSVFTRTDTN